MFDSKDQMVSSSFKAATSLEFLGIILVADGGLTSTHFGRALWCMWRAKRSLTTLPRIKTLVPQKIRLELVYLLRYFIFFLEKKNASER